MYGYREIAGDCIDCMTWDEAMELAFTYNRYSDFRYRIQGELIQHYKFKNITREHQYCYSIIPLGEVSGNQRFSRQARSNGRPAQSST